MFSDSSATSSPLQFFAITTDTESSISTDSTIIAIDSFPADRTVTVTSSTPTALTVTSAIPTPANLATIATSEATSTDDPVVITASSTPLDKTIVPQNQPKYGIPNQTLAGRSLSFQNAWYEEFKWLHYSEAVRGVLCYTCLHAKMNGTISNFSKRSDPAFIEKGFRNWKKAKEKFKKHESCESHRLAAFQIQQSFCPSVQQQLIQHNQNSQNEAQKALHVIMSSVKYLARQGLAFRGHKEQEGNFWQLLELRAIDVPELKRFLARKMNFCSWEIQNEILNMLAGKVLNLIVVEILKERFYSVMMDGTQDASGTEQQSICVRYTTKNLAVEEVFLGLHEPKDTTGKSLSDMLLEVLSSLSIPIENLRGQSYDGAGQYVWNLQWMPSFNS